MKTGLAIESYNKAIAIKPDFVETHYNLGNTYYNQGKYDLMIATYKTAISIDPNDARTHYNLACAYSLKDEKILAIETLQKAITLDRSLIEYSKTDSDFDNIRESPEFQELIKSQ